MTPPRTCSECGALLTSRSVRAVTCSNACRLKRSRRIRRANQEVEDFAAQHNAGAQEIRAIVRREAPDVITKVMKNELAPIVREALTEDVLRAIDQLVGLTPRAVAAITEDLESDDKVIRQRAYTLLIKYTVGHQALVKPEESAAGGQLVVNFELPRPDATDATATEEPPLLSSDPEEFQNCDMCREAKPLSQFVAGSSRCTECFEEWRTSILKEFAE